MDPEAGHRGFAACATGVCQTPAAGRRAEKALHRFLGPQPVGVRAQEGRVALLELGQPPVDGGQVVLRGELARVDGLVARHERLRRRLGSALVVDEQPEGVLRVAGDRLVRLAGQVSPGELHLVQRVVGESGLGRVGDLAEVEDAIPARLAGAADLRGHEEVFELAALELLVADGLGAAVEARVDHEGLAVLDEADEGAHDAAGAELDDATRTHVLERPELGRLRTRGRVGVGRGRRGHRRRGRGGVAAVRVRGAGGR